MLHDDTIGYLLLILFWYALLYSSHYCLVCYNVVWQK